MKEKSRIWKPNQCVVTFHKDLWRGGTKGQPTGVIRDWARCRTWSRPCRSRMMASTSPRLSLSLSPSRDNITIDMRCGRSFWIGPVARPYHSAALSALSYSPRVRNPKQSALISALATTHSQKHIEHRKKGRQRKWDRSYWYLGTKGISAKPYSFLPGSRGSKFWDWAYWRQ